jgi:hypothetical protein
MDSNFEQIVARDYNYQTYCQLINKENQLRLEKKSLFETNPDSWDTLITHQALIENQVFFNNRVEYLTLLKRYKDKQINSLGVEFLFLKIYRKDLEFARNLQANLELLANFEISSASDGFSNIINQLFGVCELLSESENALFERDFDLYIKEVISKFELYP